MRLFILSLFLLLSSCLVEETPTLGGTYDYQGIAPQRVLRLAEAIRAQYAPYATIYVVPEQPLSYGIAGLANQLGPHTYLIQIHSTAPDPEATIFHEMGHIIDAEEGRLDFRGDMCWMGKRCDWSIPWHERPWEISANEWKDCLIYEYKERQLKHYDYALDAWFEMYPVSLYLFK